MAPPAKYLRLRKQTVLLYSLVLLAAFVFTISSFSVVSSAISVSSESVSQLHNHDGNDDRQPLRMGRRSLLEKIEDDESDDSESLLLLKKKKKKEQSSTSSTTKLTKSPPSASSPSKSSKNQTKLIKPSSSSSGLSSSSLSKSKSNNTRLVKPTNLESEEDDTSISKKTTKLQKLNPTSSKESDSKTTKSSPATKKSSSDLLKTSSSSSSSKNTKSQSDSDTKKKQSTNKLKDSSRDETTSRKNNGKPSSSTSSSSSEKKTSTSSKKQQQTSAQTPKQQAPPTNWPLQDDEDDFVSEFRDLPTKFHKTFVPDLHRISTTSKLYLSKTTKQMTTNFKPYVGNKYASTIATVVSFSFILLPLLLVSLLFNRIIQSYSSLQKILIFIQVYLSIYFTILSLSSLVTGLEPLKFFYATSESTYVWLQVLQTFAYVSYLLLLIMYLILVFGTESGLGSKFLGLAQTFVGFAVGLHYYVAVFHRVVLHQPPKSNWKIHGLYALSFLLISFCAGADRRKKAYLSQYGGDEEGKKS